jgi:hypothetical protein
MKNSKLFYLKLLILPWLSIPLLGRNSLKKYLPTAIFICVFTIAIDLYGKRKKWWRFYKGIPPITSMSFYNWGIYFVTSLWMLKTTYGKFKLYLIFNTTLHILFTLFGLKYVKRYKIFSLVNLEKFSYFLLLFIRGVILYSFQWLVDFAATNNKGMAKK